jgi:glutaminyl-peptide cyclotransferase
VLLWHGTSLTAVRQRLKLAGILTAALLWACGNDEPAATESGPGAAATPFDAGRAFADLRAQVRIGPRPAGSPGSRREVRLIVARLRAAGLEPAVQRPHRNVVATIRGREPGVVVVGAHHDTKDSIPKFVGANDGASGVAVLLELARVLPRPLPGPSVTLAFFDAEEARGDRPFAADGARGSAQFVRLAQAGGAQGAPPLDRIRAMYLVDLVGDCDLELPREANSSPELYERLRGPAFRGQTGPVLDDHIPFRAAGIPAVDVIDFEFGPGPPPGAWFHTPEDTLDKVCPESLEQVGRAVFGVLTSS